jgi:Protein of unknown function (DUF4240)
VWLIGLGRDALERAVANPDNLASLPEVLRLAGRPVEDWSHDDWPDWESLSYVAWEAYEQVTGEEEGLSDAMEAAVKPLSACLPNEGRPRRSSSRSSWAAVLAPKNPRI